ncbi:MAG: hypothetical protein F2840_07630 [Actinobacteria bacterium]|uniref:Unannotated protein n=1 Tax=freshwater metagenome TaxID=449393 RepID=A0A6J7K8W7_9ZZZZ|nr:hypothetical protein [Actinomycetota bacterium]
MSAPLSIRFNDDLLDRLLKRARGIPGATPSGLAQLLIDEGLRLAEHPGIVFKDGPTGRRAALPMGPDLWEVVTYIKESGERGDLAIEATAKALCLPSARVRAALDYFATYRDEIEEEMAEAIEASRIAEAAWESRRCWPRNYADAATA